MARPNYSGEKRRKELERARKKQEKKQRKLENAGAATSGEDEPSTGSDAETGEQTPGEAAG